MRTTTTSLLYNIFYGSGESFEKFEKKNTSWPWRLNVFNRNTELQTDAVKFERHRHSPAGKNQMKDAICIMGNVGFSTFGA